MKQFTTVVALALVAGLNLSACAGTDPATNPPLQPQPGSDEARVQDCMKTASRSVCEMKILGP